MRNEALWQQILAFDFDDPRSEYGFSIRLANENDWTNYFTQQAIVEYKKFMYLAATAEQMVSPSSIVDIVWHQHLIFSQSYQGFCSILGKNIQHIPSTHSKADFQKFKQAKDYTTKHYEECFGLQDATIWQMNNMLDVLHLEKSSISMYRIATLSCLATFAAIGPFYYCLLPIYRKIDSSYFLPLLILLGIIAFFILADYNKKQFNKIIESTEPNSFLYHLSAFEMMYLKVFGLSHIINSNMNELLKKQSIDLKTYQTVVLLNGSIYDNAEQW